MVDRRRKKKDSATPDATAPLTEPNRDEEADTLPDKAPPVDEAETLPMKKPLPDDDDADKDA